VNTRYRFNTVHTHKRQRLSQNIARSCDTNINTQPQKQRYCGDTHSCKGVSSLCQPLCDKVEEGGMQTGISYPRKHQKSQVPPKHSSPAASTSTRGECASITEHLINPLSTINIHFQGLMTYWTDFQEQKFFLPGTSYVRLSPNQVATR